MRAAALLVALIAGLIGTGWVLANLAVFFNSQGWALLVLAVGLGIGWLVYDGSDFGTRRQLRGLPGGRFTRRGWKEGAQ